jgi:hypothetical protein
MDRQLKATFKMESLKAMVFLLGWMEKRLLAIGIRIFSNDFLIVLYYCIYISIYIAA